MRLWIAFQIPLILTSISLKDKPEPMKTQLRHYYAYSSKVVVFNNGHSVPLFAKRSLSAAHTRFCVYLRTIRNPGFFVATESRATAWPLPKTSSLPKYTPTDKAFPQCFRGSRDRTQPHSLLKPPLAMFPVDTVKEDSSRLFQLISGHSPIQPPT